MRKIYLILLIVLLFTSVYATQSIYQGDSILVTYSNIYAEVMSSPDSVIGLLIQSSDSASFNLSEISTGYYVSRRKVDSTGIIQVEVTVYGWNATGGDDITLTNSYYSRAVSDFQGSGTQDAGSNTITFVFLDTVNSEVVPYLKHNVSNSAGSVDYDAKYSLVDGTRNWSLDDDTYYINISSAVYTAKNVPETLVVSANEIDTVIVYPSATSWPNKSRVYSWILDKDGNGREGIKIEVSTQYATRYNNKRVYQYPEITYTDSLGYFYQDLIRSDSLKPENKGYYVFKATDTTTGEIIFDDVRVLVPDSSSWQLTWWRN